MIWGSDGVVPLAAHFFITFNIVSMSVWISIMVNDVATIFGFLGCTTCPIGGYILPVFFVWKLVPKEETKCITKILAIAMVVMVSLVSLGSLFYKMWSITQIVSVC